MYTYLNLLLVFNFIIYFYLFEYIELEILLPILGVQLLRFLHFTLPNFVINLLLITGIFLISRFYHFQLSPESALSIFLLIISCKTLQLRQMRDYQIIILCDFLILAGVGLFNLNLSFIIFSVLGINLLLVLLRIEDYSQPLNLQLKNNLWQSLRTTLISLPIAISLFFFFPRIKSFMPQLGGERIGQIDYSDRISNNEISSLNSNSKVIFRANLPEQKNSQELYWRGRTLNYTDGYNWNLKAAASLKDDSLDVLEEEQLTYEVFLEDNRGDLFTLDYGLQIILPDHTVQHHPSLFHFTTSHRQKNIRYTATSVLKANKIAHIKELAPYLQTPASKPKSLTELFDKTYHTDTDKFLKNLQNELQSLGFSYSLAPGFMPNLHSFLLNKKGFCTHYSSLIALLLRMQGTPARIVSGFQGGEYNEYSAQYVIRGNDAHAWVEYLTAEGYWQRVDPTGWIAPDRLQFGGHQYFERFSLFGIEIFKRSQLQTSSYLKFYNQFLMFWENLNFQIKIFLEEFNKEAQKQYANMFGVGLSSFYVIGGLIILGLIIFIYFTHFILSRRSVKPNTLARFLNHISKTFGIQLQEDEDITKLASYTKNIPAELQHQFREITQEYEQTRYSKNKDESLLHRKILDFIARTERNSG